MQSDVVVGIDDSPSAWAAVTWAAAHARSTGARLRAVHVLARPEAWEAYESPTRPAFVYPDTEALDPVWTVRTRLVFDQLDPEPSWTLQFAVGHPGQALVDASKEGSLLVLGTREHRGLDRLLKGSVSHYCINHASCPVVIVPSLVREVAPAEVASESSQRAPEPVLP